MSALEPIGRRRFTTQLALGAGGLTAAMAPLAMTLAEEDKAAEKKPAEKKPAEKKAEVSAEPPEVPPEEIVLLTYLTRRHPSDHYDEAALQGIYRDIRGDIARGKQLSEFPLTNADEPAYVFAAYRSPSKADEQKETEGTK